MLGIKYPLVKVCKRPTLPGLFRLPILCSTSLNPIDRPSFHNTIRTSPAMSFSIHLPGCSKNSLDLTISWPSTVINYFSNFFRTSSISELLRQQDFYSNQTPSKFLRRPTAFRIPTKLLREPNFYYERSTPNFHYERSTLNFSYEWSTPYFHYEWSTPNFYEWSTPNFYYERSTPNSYSGRSTLDLYCKQISFEPLL